jgi:hypothetical protein
MMTHDRGSVTLIIRIRRAAFFLALQPVGLVLFLFHSQWMAVMGRLLWHNEQFVHKVRTTRSLRVMLSSRRRDLSLHSKTTEHLEKASTTE